MWWRIDNCEITPIPRQYAAWLRAAIDMYDEGYLIRSGADSEDPEASYDGVWLTDQEKVDEYDMDDWEDFSPEVWERAKSVVLHYSGQNHILTKSTWRRQLKEHMTMWCCCKKNCCNGQYSHTVWDLCPDCYCIKDHCEC
jgi:hypothetical protein